MPERVFTPERFQVHSTNYELLNLENFDFRLAAQFGFQRSH